MSETTGPEAEEAVDELAAELARYPPFDALDEVTLEQIARAAKPAEYRAGDLVLDAFASPATELFVVLSGFVRIWNDTYRLGLEPDERIGPGESFGYHGVLTSRSLGPRAVADASVKLVRIPAAQALTVLASQPGARFLANSFSARTTQRQTALGLIDDLVHREPLTVEPTTTAAELARLMTEQNRISAVVPLPEGGYGLVTDASLRQRVLAEGLPGTAPATMVTAHGAPVARMGESAGEVLIRMLDADADVILVTQPGGQVRGTVGMRDFALGATTADRMLREQIRSAATVLELTTHGRRIPGMIGELTTRGLSSGMAIAVFSTFLDGLIRRAIELVFASRADLSKDDFTWLALGSNGRREAVFSSDVDSAVAFNDDTPAEAIEACRDAFGEINDVLTLAGISADSHGATASRKPFSRTNGKWREAARGWLNDPMAGKGVIMASLLVDGRPIYGDAGLPAVSAVFADLRRHPWTMRILLEESLASRPKWGPSTRETLLRRSAPFNIKKDALLPVVNLARWAALSMGSAALPTVERLRTASGTTMLPDDQAGLLIEVFEVLQRVRLRHQLAQISSDQRPTDQITVGDMSPIDRSVVSQAVREISAIQKRVSNAAHYVSPVEWAPRSGRDKRG